MASLILQINACSFMAPWRPLAEQDTNAPWCAPGKHPVEEVKMIKPFLSLRRPYATSRWACSTWYKHNLSFFRDTIDSYLLDLKLINNWQKSQSSINGITQKLAPYKFTFVSIDPIIVIMRPYDFGSIYQSTHSLVGNPKPAVSSKYLLNYYEYGTKLPFQPDLLWFSPDLKIEPSKLTLNKDEEKEIAWDKGILILKTVNGIIETRRIMKEK